MGIWARIIGQEQRSTATVKASDPYLEEWFGQRETEAGVHVSPHAAENLATVYSAIQAISETCGMLPFHLYRKNGDGSRTEEVNHPVARLLAGDANDTQTASEFLELMTAHCLLRGNSYAEIIRDGRGSAVKLIPIHPDCVSVVRIRSTGSIAYDVSEPNAGTRRLLADDVLHLRDRSDDGIIGRSRLSRAREAFGIAMATEQYAGSFFRNGASLSGVLTHPGRLERASAERLRSDFERLYKGGGNAGRAAVLEEGMSWQQISVSPDDAQALESRRFSFESLCRIYRVPPPILGDYASGNYASIVEIHRIFYSHCIQPWLNRIERMLERSLLSGDGRRLYEIEADCDLLLRGDMLTRFQSYRIARELGVYNANELRKFENQNARTDSGGDKYFEPMNMQPQQTGAPKKDPVIA